MKKYKAVIIGGKHSGQKFELSSLVGCIEIPGTDDRGKYVLYGYRRQITLSPIKEGDVVFYYPQ